MITSWLIENFLAASVLTFVILSVQRSLRSRPTLKHALWLLVLVKLVTPPVYNWPWAFEVSSAVESTAVARVDHRDESKTKSSLNRWESEKNELFDSSGSESALPVFDSAPPIDNLLSDQAGYLNLKDPTLFDNQFVFPFDTDQDPTENITSEDATQGPLTDSLKPAPTRSSRQIWFLWGFGIWMAGTVLFLVMQSSRILRTMLLLRNASPVPESLENKLEEFAHRLGVRCPDIVAVAGIKTPLIWAFGRARLLWPLELASDTNERDAMNRWRGVLIHELAHLHRRDHWVGWLELFAGLLWWWNPFFWVARRHLRENAELACDAWVVDCLPEERRNYAETLLEVCQLKSRSVMPWPVVGASLRDRRSIERRLEMILKDNVTLRIPKLGIVAVLVLAVMALPGWSQKQKAVDPIAAQSVDKPVAVQNQVRPSKVVDLLAQEKPVVAVDVLGALADPAVANVPVDPEQKSRSNKNTQLKKLEAQIAALTKQLNALKSGKNRNQALYSANQNALKSYSKLSGNVYKNWNQSKTLKADDALLSYKNLTYPTPFASPKSAQSHVVESQTFSRVKYRLPKDKKKAKAVTEFVKAMFGGEGDKNKTHSIESRDDNTLTVIASSAIQSKISTIIQMSHGGTKQTNLSISGTRYPATDFSRPLKTKRPANSTKDPERASLSGKINSYWPIGNELYRPSQTRPQPAKNPKRR